jgi:hypothetical protein
VIGTIEATESGSSRLLVALQEMYKENSGNREEINSSFSTSLHRKEISGMYLNIFDVFQCDTARELFAAVMFPSPSTKQSTMVRTLLINTLYTVC